VELNGWHFRAISPDVQRIVVHGDVIGAETLRRSLCDWLTDMELIPATPQAGIDGYIGYYGPYATSHDALDADTSVQDEVRATAKAVVEAVGLSRAGRLPQTQDETGVRPK
jgi:hypothetical protein